MYTVLPGAFFLVGIVFSLRLNSAITRKKKKLVDRTTDVINEVKQMKKRQTHYKVSELKTLGWTDKLIETHLGQPDKHVENPYGKRKAPMRLYLIERVERITVEKQLEDTLQSNLQKREKRSQSALTAANVKRKEILSWVDSLTITIPEYDYPELIELSCEHYNDMQFRKAVERGKDVKFRAATVNSDSTFLYRITHNFLRHEETEYEASIDELFGQVGKQEAYEALKDKVTHEIDSKYPKLMSFLVSRQKLPIT